MTMEHTTSSLRLRWILGAVLLGGPAFGCDQVERIEQDGDGGNQNAAPRAVQAIFDQKCATAGCHDATTAQAGLSLAPGAEIVGKPSSQSPLPLVELGNPNGSYLVVKILPTPPEGTERAMALMPIGAPLTGEELALIMGWIAGAPLEGGGTGGSTGGDGSGTGGGDGVADDGGSDTGGGDTGSGEPIMASAAVQAIFDASCTGGMGCHGESPALGLSLVAGADLNVMTSQGDPLVVPGDAESSPLKTKLDPEPPYGSRMPIGTPLSPDDIATVAEWINMLSNAG